MGDQTAIVNNHSSKKNGSTTKSSKRTKLINKSEQNLNLYLKERNFSVSLPEALSWSGSPPLIIPSCSSFSFLEPE